MKCPLCKKELKLIKEIYENRGTNEFSNNFYYCETCKHGFLGNYCYACEHEELERITDASLVYDLLVQYGYEELLDV